MKKTKRTRAEKLRSLLAAVRSELAGLDACGDAESGQDVRHYMRLNELKARTLAEVILEDQEPCPDAIARELAEMVKRITKEIADI